MENLLTWCRNNCRETIIVLALGILFGLAIKASFIAVEISNKEYQANLAFEKVCNSKGGIWLSREQKCIDSREIKLR